MQRGIYLRGLWDLPVLRNIKDVVNMGLDKISDNPGMVELLEQVLPKAASLLSRALPITADFSEDVEAAVEKALKKGLEEGYRLKGHQKLKEQNDPPKHG